MSHRVKLKLPLAPENRLVRWANAIRGFYGHPVYLVGSQITGSEDPRDIDIVCSIPDQEFELRYGSVQQWIQEGESGLWTDVRWIWSDDVVKKCLHGMKETKLQIDFKVQPETHFKEYANIHAAFPPVQIDTRK
jgi:hypothetical protein